MSRLASEYPLITDVIPESPYYESYRALSFRINHYLSTHSSQVILLTSAETGEGKSLVTANLGISLAIEGKRVLLIDGNLRRPMLHKVMNVNSVYGLIHVLLDECDLEDAVVETSIPNVSVLCAGFSSGSPSEFLVGRRIEKLLTRAKEYYDIILIDSPAALKFEDAKIIASKSDAFLLVVQYKKVKAKIIKKLLTKFEDLGVHCAGTILNDIKDKDRQMETL
jgi:protein-tyrosine kinase